MLLINQLTLLYCLLKAIKTKTNEKKSVLHFLLKLITQYRKVLSLSAISNSVCKVKIHFNNFFIIKWIAILLFLNSFNFKHNINKGYFHYERYLQLKYSFGYKGNKKGISYFKIFINQLWNCNRKRSEKKV